MINYAPAFLSDMRRPWLWKGSAFCALLVAGLIGAFVVAAAIGSREDGLEAMTGVDRSLLESGLSLMLTAAAVVGSFSFTADFDTGSFHRRILMFQRGAAFTGRAASITVAGLVTGAIVGVLFGLSGELVANLWHVSAPAVLAFAAIAGIGSLWGFAIGSLVRNHFLSLFVVPLSLVLPAALASRLGQFADLLFPNLVTDWVNQWALGRVKLDSFAGAITWLACLLGGAYLVFSKRDLT